ncbi:MAG: undecaprenyl-phosphate glucose phosphotransferase [Spirochaetales bacterium]|jgi:exopolysaccharide biosynthesis polyprenyl glycosylphosphotransferase|nr:undecaprenyl-phosphate glucose phosphotransferase [Spirochaetales bacterium]
MIKSYRKSFSFQLLLLDGAATVLAWALAYFIRFEMLRGEDAAGWEMVFLQLGFLALFFNVFFLNLNSLYKDIRLRPWYKELFSVTACVIQGALAIVVLYYFVLPFRVSRGQLLMYLVFAECFLALFRLMHRNHVSNLYTRGKLVHRIILAGCGEQIIRYVQTIKSLPEQGYRFLAWADDGGLAEKYGIPRIAGGGIAAAIEEYGPESVVIGYTITETAKTAAILELSFDSLVSFIVLPEMSPNFVGSTLDDFFGIPLVKINQPKEVFFAGLLKRNMDIVLSFIGILLLLPFFILLALIIKLSSRGPVFYKQERLTLDGEHFFMYKFRSMRVFEDGRNEKGWTTKDDPRITRFGAFLRKTSLDEFPQLWNILRGDMSLVGPRPERPMYVKEFRKKVPAYMLRHKMKAGLTGWAQVNGWRGDTSIEKRIEFDLYYIRNWTLWFDIKILFLTFAKGFVNKNAY